MAEYIERDSAAAFAYNCGAFYVSNRLSDKTAFPAADVAPVRHGRLRYFHKQNIAVYTECSFERNLDVNFGRAVSCPNCGAWMNGDSDA